MTEARKRGALLVLAAATLWSSGGVGVKVADASPLVIAGLRSAFAFVFILVVLLATVHRSPRGWSDLVATARRPFVWCAAVSYAVMVVLFVLAARRTTAANAIMLQYAGPIYVAILGGPVLGEKTSARDLLLVATCFLGIGLAFGGELGGGRTSGNVLAIISGFGFAGLPLFLRKDQQQLLATEAEGAPSAAALSPLFATTAGNLIGVVVALPAIVSAPPAGPNAGRTLAVIAALGIFQIGLPYVLYGMAVRKLRALESSLLATIEAVLSPIWVVLATGERPSAMALAGGLVIVGSVTAQAVTRSRAASA